MNIHFLTFATSNWVNSSKRMKHDLEEIQTHHNHYFATYEILNETHLKDDFSSYIGPYTSDKAYGFWSWKPYLIYTKLLTLSDDDILIYFDGGHSFPMDKIDGFLVDLSTKCNQLSDKVWLGLNSSHIPVKFIIRSEILEYFGLTHDEYFLNQSPHWEAGTLLIKKCQSSIDFAKTWWFTMRDNYKTLIHHPYGDKTGQCEEFVHHGGDQAVLQCLLYTTQTQILPCGDIIAEKYYIKTRVRG